MSIRDYRDLLVWQKAMVYAKEIYQLTKSFPKEEQFGLTSQIRRAAVSVPYNIAEGHARLGKEFAHFLSIARGSLAESECQLILSVDLGYLKKETTKNALSLADELKRMIPTLIRRLKEKN